MRILLIVDPQNDFCPGGSLAVPEGDRIFPVVNRLAAEGNYDLVVVSRDWHPVGHISFASSHPGHKPGDTVDVNGISQMLWNEHCVAESRGAQFHPDLKLPADAVFVLKGTLVEIDSYSAFYDNGGYHETNLRELIMKHASARGERAGDVEITLCGLATDYCVAFTARDARKLGFPVQLVVDGCRAVNINPGDGQSPSDEVRTLRELVQLGVSIVESREILDTQSRQPERERGLTPAL